MDDSSSMFSEASDFELNRSKVGVYMSTLYRGEDLDDPRNQLDRTRLESRTGRVDPVKAFDDGGLRRAELQGLRVAHRSLDAL